MVKMYKAINYRDMLYAAFFVQNIFKTHITTKSVVRFEYLLKMARFFKILFKMLLCIYIVSAFTFMIYPIYVYITESQLIPMLPIFVPGIDEKTVGGYIFLLLFQLMLVILCIAGMLAADYIFAIFVISPLIMAKFISLDMDQINIELEENGAASTMPANINARARFRNVLKMHQETIA